MTERAALLVLMAEGGELPNADFRKRFRFEVKRDSRLKLEKRDLIVVHPGKKGLRLELTPHGWQTCRQEFTAAVPPRAGAMGAVAYALMGAFHGFLVRDRRELRDLFRAPTGDQAPAGDRARAREHAEAGDRAAGDRVAAGPPPRAGTAEPGPVATGDVEARIRSAYAQLAREPGSWVALADVRSRLDGVPRAEVDRVLRRMNRLPDVNLVPESNQKTLSAQDRAAAVNIGDQDKHLLSIGAR